MSKLIAVCGSPGSGKTTTALKLAEEIYYEKKASVQFVSPDLSVPCMAYLFPNGRDSELYSLGAILDRTDIYIEDVLRETVNVKTMSNFGFLGYKLGENKYSYARPTEDKIMQLIRVLRDNTEYIIVDCTCDEKDLISSIAKRDCDSAVQLFVPDMKCISFYASCANQFLIIGEKRIKVMNIMDKDIYLPVREADAHFGGTDFCLPYEREIKQQMITGSLSERIGPSKYRAEIGKIAKAVMQNG